VCSGVCSLHCCVRKGCGVGGAVTRGQCSRGRIVSSFFLFLSRRAGGNSGAYIFSAHVAPNKSTFYYNCALKSRSNPAAVKDDCNTARVRTVCACSFYYQQLFRRVNACTGSSACWRHSANTYSSAATMSSARLGSHSHSLTVPSTEAVRSAGLVGW
jgi:hypothetical protein